MSKLHYSISFYNIAGVQRRPIYLYIKKKEGRKSTGLVLKHLVCQLCVYKAVHVLISKQCAF